MGEYNSGNRHVVVIAGGSGTRFWPLSRQGKPKQLLKIWDDRTLLEHTMLRFSSWGKAATRWVVTTRALVEPSRAALGELEKETFFLGEPKGKNTAPCIFWAIKEIQKYLARNQSSMNGDPVVCVVPADHYIADEQRFINAMDQACRWALSRGGIVTLGVRPSRPDTGYGYIQIDLNKDSAVDMAVKNFYPVAQFVEKPDLRTANEYFKSKRYLWNAGIFVFSLQEGLKAFEKCMPSLAELFETHSAIDEVYANLSAEETTSIDFGVMEVAQSQGIAVWVQAVDFGWSDLGSYTALEDIDRAMVGQVVSHNSASNIVQSDSGVVALLGVNDLVVVKQKDVVLVASKDSCQDIRKLVERIQKEYPEYS